MGTWDSKAKLWTTSKISQVTTTDDGHLSFKATAVAPHAVICSRLALLPYQGWHVRPSGGDRGDRAMLAVDVGLSEMLEFEASPDGVALQVQCLGPAQYRHCSDVHLHVQQHVLLTGAVRSDKRWQ